MSDDDYIHVRVPEIPDWKLNHQIGFVKESTKTIVVESPRYKTREPRHAIATGIAAETNEEYARRIRAAYGRLDE